MEKSPGFGALSFRDVCVWRAIGFEALSAVTRHPALRRLPFELETPNDTLEGYADEISALRDAWK